LEPVPISLDVHDKKLQDIFRRELNLSTTALFQERGMREGTKLYEYCPFTIIDSDITNISFAGPSLLRKYISS